MPWRTLRKSFCTKAPGARKNKQCMSCQRKQPRSGKFVSAAKHKKTEDPIRNMYTRKNFTHRESQIVPTSDSRFAIHAGSTILRLVAFELFFPFHFGCKCLSRIFVLRNIIKCGRKGWSLMHVTICCPGVLKDRVLAARLESGFKKLQLTKAADSCVFFCNLLFSQRKKTRNNDKEYISVFYEAA